MSERFQRSCGVLLPVFSLPSPHGIGTLGKEAHSFIDFLKKAGQTYWQMLPLVPTGCGDSPYSGFSTYAGNPYMIDLDLLVEEGLLARDEVEAVSWGSDPAHIDYETFHKCHHAVLETAFSRITDVHRDEIVKFCAKEGAWVGSYALYMALKKHFGEMSWTEWPDEEIRMHRGGAVGKYREMLRETVAYYEFEQYIFYKQWDAVRAHAKEAGIKLIGDVPIYVSLDSVDVWAEPHFFQLDEKNVPKQVAGVPPDYFSEEGQLWGNPLYDWSVMQSDGYGWWIRRIEHAAKMFDVIRIDHFRALSSYWAVPYGAATAKEGHWEKGPGEAFVNVITSWFYNTQFIAEDLGILTQDVYDLMNATKLPGMKILEFAFDPEYPSAYLPHYLERNCVCYTGTHDNATLDEWVEDGDPKETAHAREYFSVTEDGDLSEAVLRGGLATVADVFIAQMQDYLGLGGEARINVPGVALGNWTWRLSDGMLTDGLAEKMCRMAKLYGRKY